MGHPDFEFGKTCPRGPLFHTQLSLMPLMDAALIQLHSHTQEQGNGMAVVGYYCANESLADNSLGTHDKKIATRIAQKFGHSCLWFLKNEHVLVPPQIRATP